MIEDIDKRIEKAGKKGHRYVKKSFDKRRERIREKWLAKAGAIIEAFQKYLSEKWGANNG